MLLQSNLHDHPSGAYLGLYAADGETEAQSNEFAHGHRSSNRPRTALQGRGRWSRGLSPKLVLLYPLNALAPEKRGSSEPHRWSVVRTFPIQKQFHSAPLCQSLGGGFLLIVPGDATSVRNGAWGGGREYRRGGGDIAGQQDLSWTIDGRPWSCVPCAPQLH